MREKMRWWEVEEGQIGKRKIYGGKNWLLELKNMILNRCFSTL